MLVLERARLYDKAALEVSIGLLCLKYMCEELYTINEVFFGGDLL